MYGSILSFCPSRCWNIQDFIYLCLCGFWWCSGLLSKIQSLSFLINDYDWPALALIGFKCSENRQNKKQKFSKVQQCSFVCFGKVLYNLCNLSLIALKPVTCIIFCLLFHFASQTSELLVTWFLIWQLYQL